MSRMIDADAFIKYIQYVIERNDYKNLEIDGKLLTVADVLGAVICDLNGTSIYGFKNAPTVEPEHRKGKWIYGEHDVAMCDGYRCNKCGFFVPWDYKHKSIDYIKDYHFCPSCGAKMENDGGEPG